MISIVNTECHVPKTFSDLAKIAAWGRLGQIAAAVASVVTAMAHPGIAIGAILFVIVYIVAIVLTSEGSTIDAEAKAKDRAEKSRRRFHLVTVGRSLANGFSKSSDGRTLLEFMQGDGGYTRLRPHFSEGFVAALQEQPAGRAEMTTMLLDEMDRLERKWRLV
ncbi:hypothetical protein [Sphingobium sp. RAC03]|uniref:hypothetical protein n=1 Tax=Sphingobium sp. RAC03 TaxID=1843368 RepID=UPI00083D8563|nr:hypothetical protein [Sphingobium sp. RAC03]